MAAANDINTPLLASASAPGKLILFGEHAVVYGQPAIAACLSDLRIKVDVSANDNDIISVDLPDLKPDPLYIEIPCHALTALNKSNDGDTHVNGNGNGNGNGSGSGSGSGSDSGSDSKKTDLHSTLVQRGPPTPDDANKIREMLSNLKKSNSIDIHLSELHLSALVPLIYIIDTLQVLHLVKNKYNDKFNGADNDDDNDNTNTKRSRPRPRGVSIVVKSQSLPLGAGLGSSAAFSVAVSAALYKVVLLSLSSPEGDSTSNGNSNRSHDNNDDNDDDDDDDDDDDEQKVQVLVQPKKDQLDVINTLAFYSETLIHGTPSGIDNTVSCYGGALQYIKSKYGNTNASTSSDDEKKQPCIHEKEEEGGTTFIENFPQLHVILTNTNVPRSTKILVQGVREWKEEYPAIVDPILDSIGRIARTFCTNVLESQRTTATSLSLSQSKQISTLIQMNHSLLCALGVSHPSLNAITNLTSNLYNEFKCATKLTGAGGGGCAFTFFEPCDKDNNGGGPLVSMEERLKIVSSKIEGLKSCEGAEGITMKGNENNIGEGRQASSSWSFQCFSSAVGGKGVLWF